MRPSLSLGLQGAFPFPAPSHLWCGTSVVPALFWVQRPLVKSVPNSQFQERGVGSIPPNYGFKIRINEEKATVGVKRDPLQFLRFKISKEDRVDRCPILFMR